ncbi:NADH-quinone oxidoreductase subunit NuoE [Acuticoccus sp. I52.16.1]|uniref:NADH-quinone oxidoreductase subunit NuoE n=1 Tax=Acuticoccus sp. I52.16.1 TaxID=2928472 RepID=UPI001FD37BEE|nr:NADH-quinone oxidoreductase subunit NuoE [Acuticoccus sp. I52.16.1]UOM34913.1 NADH-quinone oxidoreductase subunit NuoE [Acuticoccus sp. I52.16.1]
MAVRRLAEQQPPSFEFTPQNLEWAKAKIQDYPQGRQASAVIPILWKAQEQHNGWLPEPAIRLVADMLEMPYIRVFEIATFYTMFQLQPVGTVAHIGVCGTTPCMLRGSDDLMAVCKSRIAPHAFELSEDGRFSWEEVECAGACVNAPMVQIGSDTYEDLTADSFNALIDTLANGGTPTPGPQSSRKGSEPITGATTLTDPNRHVHAKDPDSPGDGAPDSNVDPTSPAAAGENIGRPDGDNRVEVEAARSEGGAASDKVESDGEPVSAEEADRAAPSGDNAQTSPSAQEAEITPSLDTRAEEPAAPESAASEPATPETEEAPAPEASDEPPAGETPAAPEPAPEAPPAEEPVAETADTPDEAGSPAPVEAATPAKAFPPAPDPMAAERADAAGERPEARTREEVGEPDRLQRISGIGPVIEKTLRELGVFTFEQMAAWNDANKEWVNAYLAFKGRIDRERWVEQAQDILKEK